MKESTRVLVALGAAVGVGVAIASTGSSLGLRLADGLAPVGTLWVNAIRMTVIPLILSLIITGIASAADVKVLGRIGAHTLATFILLLGGWRWSLCLSRPQSLHSSQMAHGRCCRQAWSKRHAR